MSTGMVRHMTLREMLAAQARVANAGTSVAGVRKHFAAVARMGIPATEAAGRMGLRREGESDQDFRARLDRSIAHFGICPHIGWSA